MAWSRGPTLSQLNPRGERNKWVIIHGPLGPDLALQAKVMVWDSLDTPVRP